MQEHVNELQSIAYALMPIEAWAAVALVLLLGIVSFLWLRRSDRLVKRKIKSLGAKMMTNVCLSDGVDGEIYIDYLILTEKGMLIVDVKKYDGLIYGNENHDQWTQVVKQRNYQFANPLQQLGMKVLAVKTLAQDTHVDAAVLFAGRSRFPKRIPPGVLTMEERLPLQKHANISEATLSAWQEIKRNQR